MRVTLNTSNYYYSYNNKNNNHPSKNNQQSFKGLSANSHFLDPLKNGMKEMTIKIAKYYTKPLYESGIAQRISKKGREADKNAEIMQTVGSFIVSGMYMLQTLRNDKLEEQRKKTLAINQGLTLGFSMLLAHLFGNWFVGPWEDNVTQKYASKYLNDKDFSKKFKEYRKQAEELFRQNNPNLTEKELKAQFKKPALIKYVESELKNKPLANKIKGLNVLKSLIIFGSVYRFIGPVAVTPVANWIGNSLFGKKYDKKPTPVQTEIAENTKTVEFKKPELKTFLNK